ncbi:DNA polymerase III subunit delta [Dasania marina]|uniref:DNA polymerase III subunit delta n=1 Tax=Dasania marina TaxID=471499 RepID=UPI0030DB0EDA|tara:strand:- start:12159 stop:13181 length:1023 start_codon:yes stop_codon:yes gene_type:complete
MKIKAEQLAQQLKKQLLPVYLLHGDEPLLIQECADHVRHACKAQGFGDRDIIHVENNFTGEELYASNQAISLFADRKIIELRMPTGKPGTAGSKALVDYVANPSPDNVLLIICGKIESASQRSKWFKTVEAAGASVQLWPINARDLPRWIEQRLRALGMQANPDAIELLADRVEGNLLAASQEIHKLQLYAEQETITVETVMAAVADSARYNIFGLIDSCLEGDTLSALKMLQGLKSEGNQVFAILPLFTRELRNLYACAQQIGDGHGIDRVLQNQRIWDSRKRITKIALQKLSLSRITRLIQLANDIDQSAKGMSKANSWDLLEQLITLMTGRELAIAL